MSRGKSDLYQYIRTCLNKGHPHETIRLSFVKNGYSERAADGIMLSYKHRGKFLKWFVILCLACLFFSGVFIGGSGIIGMVSLGFSLPAEENLNISANSSSLYSWYPINNGEIVSISITGNIIGDGDARLYIENQGADYLIYDSAKMSSIEVRSSTFNKRIRHFETKCADTCKVEYFNNSVYNIKLEIDDATLEIEKISYNVKALTNVESLPSFTSVPNLTGSPIKLDLSSYFNNSRRNATYNYISSDDSLNIQINGNAAEISGKEGIYHAFFIAKQNGIEYLSNLVTINILGQETNYVGPIMEPGLYQNALLEPKNELPSAKQSFFSGAKLFLTIGICVLLLITLALLPAYHFDIYNLANRLKKSRKNILIDSQINEFDELKKKLAQSDNPLEQEKLIDNMQKKIKSVKNEITNNPTILKFDNLSDELANAKTKDEAEKIYQKLRGCYIHVLKSKIRDKDKKDMYKKIERYYKYVKNF